MKKEIGKKIINTLKNEGWLDDKASFEKLYKKIEERLENETNKLKKKNNDKLVKINANFFNLS